jgi:hypothetical protein
MTENASDASAEDPMEGSQPTQNQDPGTTTGLPQGPMGDPETSPGASPNPDATPDSPVPAPQRGFDEPGSAVVDPSGETRESLETDGNP